MRGLQLVLLWVIYITGCTAVKDYLFKNCEQNGFCNRNRHYANEISSSSNFESPYYVDPSSVQFWESNATILGDIQKRVSDKLSVRLPFQINILENNSIRLRIDEDRSRVEIPNKLLKVQRWKDAWKYAFNGEPRSSQKFRFNSREEDISIVFGEDGEYEATLQLSPFKVTVSYNGDPQIVLNDRSFLNVEHFRTEQDNEQNILPQESSFNSFKDDFKDSRDDSLPFGPESVAADVSFIGFKHVYGIPEHAETLSLRDTSKSDPYRLYNVDIFEYETHSLLPMYGSIPFMLAHKPYVSAGIFWINGADTYIDIKKEGLVTQEVDGEQKVLGDITGTGTHWFSESGIIDVVLFIGKTPAEITRSYSQLTGTVQLPQLFSIAYHQCRWNYNDEEDVLSITKNMDKYEIPYDAIWLDIEYTDSKKYFTWKKELFPNPEGLMNKLGETGRTLITIIDPHIKTGYSVSDKLEKSNLAVLNKDGNPFKGHCWPGESVWIDTFKQEAVDYWTELFQNGTDYAGESSNFQIWNDMNEPSVFSGPETTSPKDLITGDGVEIRDDHNIYGLTYHEATYEALQKRFVNKRPFILTRAYYSGSQRTSAMWSGDNMSKWEYLKISIPMLLTSNVVGMPFSGSDVGGFFGNPTKELLVRWYQAGIWYPFFRGHAHIDSKRREPWVPGEPYTSHIRNALKIRYSLLPLFYTKFYESNQNGDLIIKPIFYNHPYDSKTFEIEDEFYLDGLLVKPVTDEGATFVEIYLPDDSVYYKYDTYEKVEGEGYHTIDAPLNEIPIFIKSGSLIPRKDRYRRSSKLMKYDPYTLVAALDSEGKAHGSLYIDDGETFDYLNGEFLYIEFEIEQRELRAKVKEGLLNVFNKVEKIEIIGASSAQTVDVLQNNITTTADALQLKNSIIIKKPNVDLSGDWTIKF